MRPNVDNVLAHECREAEGGFHIVGEYEEGTASGDDTTVQCQTVHNTSHCQLANACVEEAAAEVALGDGAGMFEEAVGLVRVAKVSRRNNHIVNLRAEHTENRCTCCTSCAVGLNRERRPINLGLCATKPTLQSLCLLGVSLCPSLLCGVALCPHCCKLLATCVVECYHLGEECEGLLGVTTQVGDCSLDACARIGEGLTVGRNLVLVAAAICGTRTLTHQRMADDEGGALALALSGDEGCLNLLGVVAVDVQHVPVPRTILGCDILAVHLLDGRRELYVVCVVEHNEVAQAEVTCYAAYALRNLLLDTTIGDEGVDFVRCPLAKAVCHDALSDCCAESHSVSLSERAAGVLDTVEEVNLGVSGGDATPLTEVFELLGGHNTCQGQHSVEHGRHVAGVEEETIAEGVVKPCGVVAEVARVEDVDKVCSAHSTSGVTRFCFFDHSRCENADVVCCSVCECCVHRGSMLSLVCKLRNL